MKKIRVTNKADFDVCLGVVKNGGIDRNILMLAKSKVMLDVGETINRRDLTDLDGLVVCTEIEVVEPTENKVDRIAQYADSTKKPLPQKNNSSED